MNIGDHKILLLGVYLPYDSKQNFDQYVYDLGLIKSIIGDFASPYVCVLRDFDAGILRQSDFGNELWSFCEDACLNIADVLHLPPNSITHINEGSDTESWIDHIVCTDGFLSFLCDMNIDASIVSSDHFAVSIKIQFLTPNDSSGQKTVRM